MKKKIFAVFMICTLVLCFTGCDLFKKTETKTNDNTETKESTDKKSASKDPLNDNSSYYVIIKGTKFSVGDKLSTLSKVGLRQDSRVLEETVRSNTYLIGAGSIYDSNDKDVLSMTPYNPGSSSITVKEAVFGSIEAGSYEYGRIGQEVLDLDLEFVGGIKFGSTLEDVEKVFGTTDDVYEASSLGYKVYTYRSEKNYRNFEFTIDKDGKVSKIGFQNLVFNEK